MRLIDAEALKAKWYDINDIDETDRGARFVGYTEIARLIDQAPTVSADAEHDRCDGCRYEHNTEYEYPCSECKQNHVDMWEQKPNDFIEVVRCKDCKYSFYDKDYESYNCRKHEYVECFDADDYCSWGERND